MPQPSKKTKGQLRARRRHVAVWAILQVLLGPVLRRVFRLRLEPLPDPGGPRLIMCNHPTMLDPLFLGLASPKQFYFLSSESLYQKGLRSWLLERYLCPVVRQKGTVAAGAVIKILRLLRAGGSVCIFPEGIVTANGEGCAVLPTTGKLVKASGVTLVNYRFEGGYLARPKWAAHMRKGPIFGKAAGVYPPEQLAGMTAEEITALIQADLMIDDYAWQEKNRVPYPAPKGLAEGLENALYLCPRCGAMNSLHTRGDHVGCACGLEATMDAYGFFTGGAFPTVLAWDRWQTAELQSRLDAGTCTHLENDGATLYTVRDHRPQVLCTGMLRLTRQALGVGDYSFPLEQVTGLEIHGRNYMVFFVGDTHYEIKTLKTRARYSPYPYRMFCRTFAPTSAGRTAIM